jgi:Na+-driven multidrug efflux pump
MGSGETEWARLAAYKGMYFAFIISVYFAAILLLISGDLPKWLTPDPTLQKMIFETLPLIAFGQVLMSIGMVCWNVLGAQGRVRLATIIEFAVSWLLVMPMAVILVYSFDFNLMGLVGPLVLGYTIGCVVTTYLLITSDWEGLSRKVIVKNGGIVTFDEVRGLCLY